MNTHMTQHRVHIARTARRLRYASVFAVASIFSVAPLTVANAAPHVIAKPPITTATSNPGQNPSVTDGMLCPPQAVTCNTIAPGTQQWTNSDGSGGFVFVHFRIPEPTDPGAAMGDPSEIPRRLCGLRLTVSHIGTGWEQTAPQW